MLATLVALCLAVAAHGAPTVVLAITPKPVSPPREDPSSEVPRNQLNAMRSYQALQPDVDTVVFATDHVNIYVARRYGFTVITDFEVNEYGAPRLHSVFKQTEALARQRGAPLVCYANADIALGPDFAVTAKKVASLDAQRVLAVGLRYNTNVRMPDDFIARDKPKKVGDLLRRGHPFQQDAQDYFLFKPGTLDYNIVPDFLIGRVAYDNWLVNYANSQPGIMAIDTSKTVSAVHLNHGKSRKESHKNPDNSVNRKLGKGQYQKGQMHHCKWRSEWRADKSVAIVERARTQPRAPPRRVTGRHR